MTSIDQIISVGSSWSEIKTLIEHSLGFDRGSLHILAGVCVQLLVAALFRTTLGSPWPWIAVLVLAFANEWHDIAIQPWPSPAMQLGEGIKDLALTMLLPTLLLLTSRYAPGLLVKEISSIDDDDEAI